MFPTRILAAFITLYCAIVRPHVEKAMKANSPNPIASINHLGRVQRLATRRVRGPRHVPYEERLRQLNLFSLERRCLRADLTMAFNIFKVEIDLRPLWPGLREHTYILLQGPSPLRRRSGASDVRVVKYWNIMQPSIFMSTSGRVF